MSKDYERPCETSEVHPRGDDASDG